MASLFTSEFVYMEEVRLVRLREEDKKIFFLCCG